MIKDMKDFVEIVSKISFSKCGNVTCIHNIDNKCILKQCEVYEKGLHEEH